MAFKNVIVAGASGIIGTPIISALLSSGLFKVSGLSRHTSEAKFPPGVTIKRANLSSRESLVAALRGQDVLICTLNDEASALHQGTLIEAAYEAGVKRYMPNEWSSHDMTVEGTVMQDAYQGKREIVKLLDGLVEKAKKEGREFSWTGLNTGVFFDWALHASFLDITLPPTNTAQIWDAGTSSFSGTTLSAVARAVVTILTTADKETRNKLLEISSLTASQNEIVAALEKVSGNKWDIEKTSLKEQLKIAGEKMERGQVLEAVYIWIRVWIFGGREGAVLRNAREGNTLLGVKEEKLEDIVGKVIRGENV